MSPHLSTVPGERALQRWALVFVPVAILPHILGGLLRVWGAAALGGDPSDARLDAWMSDHGWTQLAWGSAVAVSVASLLLPRAMRTYADDLRSVAGLRNRYLIGGVVTIVLSAFGFAVVGILVGLVACGYLLRIKPVRAEEATGQVEGGSFG